MNVKKLIEVLSIVNEYADQGGWVEGQHDMILFPLMEDTKLDPEHEKRLRELGCFIEDGGWITYT